jgi:hypothetical protein
MSNKPTYFTSKEYWINEKTKSVSLQYICAVLIFAVLMVLLAAEVILYSLNTLTNHPMWVNGKLLLAAPGMGADKAAHTRNI